MAIQTCGYNGCSNPIRAGAAACWRHLDIVEGRAAPAGGRPAAVAELDGALRQRVLEENLGREAEAIRNPPATAAGRLAIESDLMIDNSEIAEDAAPAVAAAVEEMRDAHPLDVPAYVAPRLLPLLHEFQHRLVASGVARGRLATLRLVGLHRRTPKGKMQHAEGFAHAVTVLDRGTPRQVTVDPLVAVLTPVRFLDRSIADQYDIPASPLADIPMVASPAEYHRGAYIYFDSLTFTEEPPR